MGQLVVPDRANEAEVRFELETLYSYPLDRIFFVEYANRFADVESVFKLLHLLQHLNGTASESIIRMATFECINSIAFRTLIHHHRAKGSAYRLYT